MQRYKVVVVQPGSSTFDPDLVFTKTVTAYDRTDAERKALIDERPSCYVSEITITNAAQGSALTPVIAILTVFTVGAVLIAQSGLVNALLARFAQVFNG